MKVSKDCALCENEITSLKIGLTCKLTKRKPNFENICAKIKLDKTFQKNLELALLELEIIRRKRKSFYLVFYFLIIIGLSLIMGSNYLTEWPYYDPYFWVKKIAIIGIGISFISDACYKLNSFIKELKNAEHKKNKIDTILNKYKISYSSTVTFNEKKHGLQEVNVELEFKNWKKKNTSTFYHINDYN